MEVQVVLTFLELLGANSPNLFHFNVTALHNTVGHETASSQRHHHKKEEVDKGNSW